MSTETVEEPKLKKEESKPVPPRKKFDFESKIVKKLSIEKEMNFDSGEYIKFRLAKGLKAKIINAAGKKSFFFIEDDEGTKHREIDSVRFIKEVWDHFVLEIDPPGLDIVVLDNMEGSVSAQIYLFLNECYIEIIGELPQELKKKSKA